MPKGPRSAVLVHRDWCAAVTFSAALSAVACATAESPEFAPPVNDGGTAGTGGSSGAGVSGSGVSGSATTGGSAGTAGATGGSAGSVTGGSAGTGIGGSAGKGGSAGISGGSAGTAAGSGGSSGTSTTGGTAGSSAGGSGNTAGTSNGGSAGTPTGVLYFEDFEEFDPRTWISRNDENEPVTGWSVVTDGSAVFKQGTASSDPSWSVGGDIAWTDQIVEVKIKFDDVPDESAAAMVAARFTSFDSYYYLEVRGDGGIKIRKRVDGSTGDVTRYDPDAPLVGNTWYTVGIGAVGTTLTAYFGGVAVAMGTDSDLAEGGIGLGTAEEAIVSFDDVSVTAP